METLTSSCVIPRQSLFPVAIIYAPLVGWKNKVNKINPKFEQSHQTIFTLTTNNILANDSWREQQQWLSQCLDTLAVLGNKRTDVDGLKAGKWASLRMWADLTRAKWAPPPLMAKTFYNWRVRAVVAAKDVVMKIKDTYERAWKPLWTTSTQVAD